jgi:SAM-dependent methyltransferase
LPLSLRKRGAILCNHLPGEMKERLILLLLDDWGAADPPEYHRFIWGNHLLFAKHYDFRTDVDHSRGEYFTKLHPLRLELLETVAARLRDEGISPERDVRSILDVGSSLGYMLRHAETTLFPGAQRLLGIDIDAYAIEQGTAYLRSVGSSVTLEVADLDALERVVGGESFDIVLCTGVLHYLDEDAARRAIGTMLALTSGLLGLSGPACEEKDNAELESSQRRAFYRDDLSLIHNFDRMVLDNGGRVVARRWGGGEIVEKRRGSYIVVAAPANATS